MAWKYSPRFGWMWSEEGGWPTLTQLEQIRNARAQASLPTGGSMVAVGDDAPQDAYTLDNITKTLKKIGPSLLIVGVATGAAIAIGSGLVNHYLFKGRR